MVLFVDSYGTKVVFFLLFEYKIIFPLFRIHGYYKPHKSASQVGIFRHWIGLNIQSFLIPVLMEKGVIPHNRLQ